MSMSLQPKAAKAPKELGKPFNPGVQVNRIRFSPDGKLLSAACFDGRVRHWVVTGKEPVGECPKCHSRVFFLPCFISCGEIYSSGSGFSIWRSWTSMSAFCAARLESMSFIFWSWSSRRFKSLDESIR